MPELLKKIAPAILLLSVATLLFACSRDPERRKAKYFAVGESYLKQQKYGDAAIEFRNALKLDPRFVNAYYQLAQADIAQRDWSSAYVSLEKTIDLAPDRLDARLDRGRLYLAARQFDKAEDEANFILTKESRNVAAYQLLGTALIGERKQDDALAAFTKVTELSSNDPSAYVNLALVDISLHRFADAEQQLKKAVEVDPQSTQAYSDLANFYRLENRLPEAEQVLQDGIAKSPEATRLYLEWASVLLNQGKGDEAESVLNALRSRMTNSADAAMAIGDFYFDRNQADQALAEYRRGLSFSPNSLDIQKRMQDVYLTTNQIQLATDMDRELMKNAPKDVLVRVEHSRLLIAQGKFQDATGNLQKIIKDAADSTQAYYYLAMAYWQSGDMGRAHDALLDTLKVFPGFPLAFQALARLSLTQGNASDARIYSQELVDKFPADSADRKLLAEALAAEGQLKKSEEQCLVASQLAPRDPVVRIDLAHVYSLERKWTEAQRELETALNLDPHNTTALNQLADFLTDRNQPSQAFDLVQQYVTANPNDENGHLILGALNSKAKNYTVARAEFERAHQIAPQSFQAFLQLGTTYESENQIDLAIATYQKALALQPQFAPLATVIGNLFLNKGDLETARKYYSAALAADPHFAIANANTAWVDAQQGKNLDVALGMAQKAKSMMPDVPSITDTLGWVLYKRGNYAQAMPFLKECVDKSPDSAQFRYHFGMNLLAAGDQPRAKQELEAALRMKLSDPDAVQARQTLAKLD